EVACARVVGDAEGDVIHVHGVHFVRLGAKRRRGAASHGSDCQRLDQMATAHLPALEIFEQFGDNLFHSFPPPVCYWARALTSNPIAPHSQPSAYPEPIVTTQQQRGACGVVICIKLARGTATSRPRWQRPPRNSARRTWAGFGTA